MELLAPAGSAVSLRAAVQSGADAVYLGGTDFGARQSAENFTDDEMKRWIEYCHLYGVSVHITVNTLVKEKELAALQSYAKRLNEMGADALIVQDLGAADVIKNTCPDLMLHASTQMSVTTADEVNELEKLGFSRVVLARELNEKEIGYICKNTNLEIEVFVHGAICQCYSGKCLMSSILGGRSGNRGRCAQPCRLPYELIDGRQKSLAKGYLLSPKDMALINDLGTLKRIGVDSLKIEGRLKRAEYVSSVVGIYRKYLDIIDNNGQQVVSRSDMKILTDAFSRGGFTNGYLKNRLGAEMMSGKSPSGTGDTKFTDDAKARTAENANIRKIPVNIMGSLKYNSPLEVTIYDNDGHYGYAEGAVCSEAAKHAPLDADRIAAQLKKLGSSPFVCDEINVYTDDGITIPIKEINSVRRAACDALTAERIKHEARAEREYKIPEAHRMRPDSVGITVTVTTEEQRRAAKKNGISNISEFKPFDGTLNVYNSQTANRLSQKGAVILSPELNLHEMRELSENTSAELEVIAYGHLPLMIMKNCPAKAAGFCQSEQSIYRLRDRRKEEFPLVCDGRYGSCRSVLLNSKPVYMADRMKDLLSLKINSVRLIFTVENFLQCDKIINEYKRALDGEIVGNIFAENGFTRGHFYRGVM